MNHDKDCERLGGFHGCKCWLRATGEHKALAGVREWSNQQAPEDQRALVPLIEQLNETMHLIDLKQATLREMSREQYSPKTATGTRS